jgi:hypothetical protein
VGGHALGAAIGEVLPFAVALAAGPLPIIAIVLILVSDNAKAKGIGFVLGRVVGLAVLVGAGLVVAALLDDPKFGASGHPQPAASVARIVIGVLLIALAFRKWRRRNEPSRPNPLTRRIDGLSGRGAAGMGLLVSVLDPTCLSLAVLSGLDIAAARQPTGTTLAVAAGFVVVSALPVVVPLAGYLAGGQAARTGLDNLKGWLLSNENAVMIVLFLLAGAMLVGRGIRDLAGV